jgi:hypothetical protein
MQRYIFPGKSIIDSLFYFGKFFLDFGKIILDFSGANLCFRKLFLCFIFPGSQMRNRLREMTKISSKIPLRKSACGLKTQNLHFADDYFTKFIAKFK